MQNKNFSITILVNESPAKVFNAIKDVRGWWSGLYGEEIEGSTDKLNDEFTFRAGEGAHYSKQKLIELIPFKKIVWQITDSKLTFLEHTSEWTGTKISFKLSEQDNQTKIVFTHLGLVPKIECYESCSGAWSQYLQQFLSPLASKLKA